MPEIGGNDPAPIEPENWSGGDGQEDQSVIDGELESEEAEEGEEVSIAQLVDELTAERDEYLRALQLTKADFDNYRRRTQRTEAESAERRVVGLLEKLLPNFDDLASLYQFKLGSEDEDLIAKTVGPLFSALAAEGLERIEATGVPFDPALHQAVMHEEGDDGPLVAEVLRTGYAYKGKTLRPAMVKVVG